MNKLLKISLVVVTLLLVVGCYVTSGRSHGGRPGPRPHAEVVIPAVEVAVPTVEVVVPNVVIAPAPHRGRR